MRKKIVLAGLLLSGLLAACGSDDDNTGSPATAPAVSSAAFDDADVMFAQGMIPHHEQALEMSALALAADASPEVTALAKEIQAAQDPEIVLMRSWLRDW